MLDKFLGLLALAVMIGFTAVLFAFIPDFDLGLLILIVAAAAGYDFYLMLFKRRTNGR